MKIGDEQIIIDSGGRRRKCSVVECLNCHKLFPKPCRFIKRRNGKHYCTTKCQHAASERRVDCECGYCHKRFSRPINRSISKSGLVFCSRKCKELAQTYKVGLLQCGNEPGDYRTIAFAHYKNKCAWCNEDLISILEVHHIDGDRLNNSITNLIILCPSCHAAVTRKLLVVVNRNPVANQMASNVESITRWLQNRNQA